MDIVNYNRAAWDRQVEKQDRWTVPVDADTIRRAKSGDWQVVLTPNKPVPAAWFPPLPGTNLLCLASAGGQQAPILAAAGATVTSFDNSPKQLGQDRFVAERDGLDIRLEQGDMADLSRFSDASFDLIFHPVSNVFVPDVLPVWRECSRVLKPGGRLLAGLMNPAFYMFDMKQDAKGILEVKYPLPFSDVEHLPKDELQDLINKNEAMNFSHTLEALLGGQLRAGLVLTDLYEDTWTDEATTLNKYMPLFLGTLARK